VYFLIKAEGMVVSRAEVGDIRDFGRMRWSDVQTGEVENERAAAILGAGRTKMGLTRVNRLEGLDTLKDRAIDAMAVGWRGGRLLMHYREPR
jgi:hypothetical protein